MKKVVYILLLVTIIFIMMQTITYATTIDSIMGGAENFISAGDSGQGINSDGIKNASDLIYNTLLIIGVIVAVLVAAFLGIKFIVSSVEEQAKVKEALIPFIVGCFIVFGAFGIWRVTTNILNTTTRRNNQSNARGIQDATIYVRALNGDRTEINNKLNYARNALNSATTEEDRNYWQGYIDYLEDYLD